MNQPPTATAQVVAKVIADKHCVRCPELPGSWWWYANQQKNTGIDETDSIGHGWMMTVNMMIMMAANHIVDFDAYWWMMLMMASMIVVNFML